MNRVLVSTVTECLRELADRSYQERVWATFAAPEQSSFEEAVCGLYDDSGLGNELDKSHAVFSAVADAKLRVLGDKLSAIDSNRAPLEIIKDPKMEEVRVLARELLDLLAKQGVS